MVTVNGTQVFNQVVPVGATAGWTTSVTMPACTAGQNVPWNVVAIATNDCDQVGQRKEQTVPVQCKNPPCVQLLDVRANKADACPNEPVTVSGRVKNCGTDSANYTVTVGGVQVFSGSLAPGAEQSFSREVNMGACTAGNNVTWAVHATASNSCGNASADAEASVRCKSQPCVEVTASGPPSSCADQNITISGSVRNCSLDSETIVVTVDGVQAFSGSVAGGASANWTLSVRMKPCTAGQSVSYAVVATATNSCGTTSKPATVNVACLAPPCLALELNAPAKSCVGVAPADLRFGDELLGRRGDDRSELRRPDAALRQRRAGRQPELLLRRRHAGLLGERDPSLDGDRGGDELVRPRREDGDRRDQVPGAGDQGDQDGREPGHGRRHHPLHDHGDEPR